MRTSFLISLLVSVSGSTLFADESVPKTIAPHFKPPAKFAKDFGKYRSPLKMENGKLVKNAEQWKERREEILKTWHNLMGTWPALLEKPTIERIGMENREGIRQYHVRIEVAPNRKTEDCYLLMPPGKGPHPAVVVVYYEALTGIGKKGELRDFAWQLAKRGFVTLSLGSAPESYYPSQKERLQPLSYHAYVAANCHTLLARMPIVDENRIGIVGHSYGGKWAMFASCLYEKFACAAWSDPGIVFDEARSNVNYWDRWYLGHVPDKPRKRGRVSETNPRTGPYKTMMETGRDLHELHALMAPRPFLVSGGAEDQPERWRALNHSIAVNKLLGVENRVAMTNRKTHSPTKESNEQIYQFFEHFLKPTK